MEAIKLDDIPSAFQASRLNAYAGNSNAQVIVFALYQVGLVVEPNVLEAERLLPKVAAENQSPLCRTRGR
jgi:hypothetical protein